MAIGSFLCASIMGVKITLLLVSGKGLKKSLKIDRIDSSAQLTKKFCALLLILKVLVGAATTYRPADHVLAQPQCRTGETGQAAILQ